MVKTKDQTMSSPKVVYHSCDFDGCISNEVSARLLGKDWTNTKSNEQANQAYLTANSALLNSFKRGDATKTILLVGSNRQDPYMDFRNGTGTEYPPGSVFPRMEAIAEALGDATFVPFLLADLGADEPEVGQTYRTFKENGYLEENGSYKQGVKPSTFQQDGFKSQEDDDSKITLLFAQMQFAAMSNPNEQVEFNFYDDRKDIVERLLTFFQEHPERIPENITLNIVGYSGPIFTQEQANESCTNFVMHTTTNLDSKATLDVIDDAQKNNFPVLIQIPGEKNEFKIYKRSQDGTWGFDDFDGVIPGLEAEKLTKMFPDKDGGRSYPSTSAEPEVFSWFKNQHFLPVPLARMGRKPGYNYGEPTRFAPIQGTGSIPTKLTDWLPVYKTLHPTKSSENSLPSQRIETNPAKTAEQIMIDIYTGPIKQDINNLLQKEIALDALSDARNELCAAISAVLESPQLSSEDCYNLKNILRYADLALESNNDLIAKSQAISELEKFSDNVRGKPFHTWRNLSLTCATFAAFAAIAAIVAVALAPTGIGFVVGAAIASTFAIASVGAWLHAKYSERDLSKKTRAFKDVLENIKGPEEMETDKKPLSDPSL